MIPKNFGGTRLIHVAHRLRRLGFWMGTAGILSCGQAGESVAEYMPPSTTAAGFTDVELGMSYRALRRVRPNAEPSPYTGAAERVATGDTVFYHFDKPPLDRQRGRPLTISWRARLVGVSEVTVYPSSAAAEARWAATVGELERRGDQVRCYSSRSPVSGVFLRSAVISHTHVRSGISLYPEHTFGDITGTHRMPATTRASVRFKEPENASIRLKESEIGSAPPPTAVPCSGDKPINPL